MGRWIAIVGFAVLITGVAISDYAGYRSLKEMRSELRSLRQDVNEASRTAQEESAAVAAASRRAEEAAARAGVAADLRQQAESGRHQAETVAQQAQAAAQQASEQNRAAQEQNRAAQEKMAGMQRERQAELDQMQQALNRVVETRRTPNGMVISLPNSVFRFDFDSADLSARNRELLSRIGGILLVSKGFGLSIFGYTDDVGTPEYNQQLSLRRANAVKDYLIQAGIDPAIINVKGYGKTSPLIENMSDEGRAKNRRVEIALTDSSIRFQ